MVLDRLFLWIFTLAVLAGTAAIILQAPTLYDDRMPIDKRFTDFTTTSVVRCPPQQQSKSLLIKNYYLYLFILLPVLCAVGMSAYVLMFEDKFLAILKMNLSTLYNVTNDNNNDFKKKNKVNNKNDNIRLNNDVVGIFVKKR